MKLVFDDADLYTLAETYALKGYAISVWASLTKDQKADLNDKAMMELETAEMSPWALSRWIVEHSPLN